MNDLKRRTLAIMKQLLPFRIEQRRHLVLEPITFTLVSFYIEKSVMLYSSGCAIHDGMDEFNEDAGLEIAKKRAIRSAAGKLLSHTELRFVRHAYARAARELANE